MDYSYEYAAEGGIGFIIFYVIYMLLVSGVGIAAYVLRSLGVYTIAKRRGIRNAWFSWIPVVDLYLLGCISDQFQYVVKGKVRNKRKVLLGLNIAMWVIYAVMVVCLIVGVVRGLAEGMGPAAEDAMIGPILGMMGLMLPMAGFAIAVAVIRYMALYDLYTSCSPMNNVMFLVLSIVFNVTEPFFIFFNRKKDEGMPPRKDETVAEPVTEIPQPVTEVDPWDRPDSE